MKLLLKDGIKYLPYRYKDEDELEQMVIDHYEVIFDKNAVFFQKQKDLIKVTYPVLKYRACTKRDGQ